LYIHCRACLFTRSSHSWIMLGGLGSRKDPMTFADKTLACRDCNVPFVFTVEEQEFFRAKALVNEPRRCPNCRLSARMLRNGNDKACLSSTTCANCGIHTQVPFQPRGLRPVYCLACHHRNRQVEKPTLQPATPDSSCLQTSP
jgi:CxxC-x17-CxxC domain-containing protein